MVCILPINSIGLANTVLLGYNTYSYEYYFVYSLLVFSYLL